MRIFLLAALVVAPNPGCGGAARQARRSTHSVGDLIATVEGRWPELFRAAVVRSQPAQPFIAKAIGRAPASQQAALTRGYRDGRLAFFSSSGVSPSGRAVGAMLEARADHALPRLDQPFTFQSAWIEQVKAACVAAAQAPTLTLSNRRQIALWAQALSAEQRSERAAPLRLVLRLLSGRKAPQLGRHFEAARRVRATCLEARAKAELALARPLLSMLSELSMGLLAAAKLLARDEAGLAWHAPLPKDSGRRAKLPLALREPAIHAAQTHGVLLSYLRHAKDARAALARVIPDPGYVPLQKALRRYRAMAPFPTVDPGRCARTRRGCSMPTAGILWRRQLHRRLAAEGYGQPTLDAAVDAFRDAHGLEDRKRLTRSFFRALAVPRERKIQLIAGNLQRLQRSPAPHFARALRVNIPAYQLTLWSRRKVVARHRVVVGSGRGQKCDEHTERVIPASATPVVAGRISHLIFAPFWNVTTEIKRKELDPERARDSLFLEKNGYELMQAGKSTEWVRQLPGPSNSLGFVKFIFDNPHQIFLHDTPDQRLFERRRRDHSHGCVRVERASQLARRLLALDGKAPGRGFVQLRQRWRSLRFGGLKRRWDPQRYEDLRERAHAIEKRVNLQRPLPIFTEYLTVEVDGRGRLLWHPDIYGLDRVLWDPGYQPRRCIPESRLARKAFVSSEAELKILGSKAVALAGCAERWASKQRGRSRLGLRRFSVESRNLHRRAVAGRQLLETRLQAADGRWTWGLIKRAMALRRLTQMLQALVTRAEKACAAGLRRP